MRKRGNGIKLILYDIVDIPDNCREGLTKGMDPGEGYGVDWGCPPYFTPQIQDILNDRGFSFHGHKRISDGMILEASDSPYCGIFSVVKFFDKENCMQQRGWSTSILTTPSIHRNDQKISFDYADVYMQ